MADKISSALSPPAAGAAHETAQSRAVTLGREQANSGQGTFAETLQAQSASVLRFSAHAQERLRSRDIELSDRDQADLAKAVEIAGAKGAQESLIVLDDLALIVNIRNKVVITALERGEVQPNVFTNIDSAVVLPRNRVDKSA